MQTLKPALVLLIALLPTACGGGGGSSTPSAGTPVDPPVTPVDPPVTPVDPPVTPVDPPLPPISRSSNPDCIAPDYPSVIATDIQLQPAFPSLPAIESLVGLYQAPDDDSQWYALNKGGFIYQFDNTAAVSELSLFLDISSDTLDGGEAGLLGLAFHPDFSSNGYVFIYYITPSSQYRLSRLSLNTAGTALDRSSEKIILSGVQPATNHNGGGLHFGPDSYLYLSLGDGGGGGDTYGNGQNTSTLLSTIVRLDVDVPNDAINYEIPPGNPFANGQGGQPEIYAYGLRNPWRWSFDRNTGELWLADVGESEIEEIDIIQAGGNYGWPIMEGSQCYNSNQCDQSGLVLPVGEYTHSATGGCSITGGYVYRGQEHLALTGSYVFGDYCTGVIYTLAPDGGAYTRSQLLDSPLALSTFAEDNDGELYAINVNGGAGQGIYKFVAGNINGTIDLVPDALSETGCYQDTATQTLSEGVTSYSVNSPLWSDGAGKLRYFALPDNTRFSLEADGDFISPDNSILIKNFYHDGEIIETRLLMKHITGWAGYSYEWNDDKTDATLLLSGKVEVIDNNYSHIFPSREQCLDCHIPAAGMSLGLETLQFNYDVNISTGQTENFLDRLYRQDYLAAAVAPGLKLSKLVPLDDAEANLEDKARSYLHSNCAGCHRPGGPIPGIDLRFTTALADTGVCMQTPNYGNLGVPGAQLLMPGDASQSVLALRMLSTGSSRMPPLGTSLVDQDAVAVISDWINSLTGCN